MIFDEFFCGFWDPQKSSFFGIRSEYYYCRWSAFEVEFFFRLDQLYQYFFFESYHSQHLPVMSGDFFLFKVQVQKKFKSGMMITIIPTSNRVYQSRVSSTSCSKTMLHESRYCTRLTNNCCSGNLSRILLQYNE